ncbi:MAG: transcription antitermination factor NusB [Acidobacteria bacterium]|nr:transcription antitermination factor NusB [Acidobacteriota bacterium]
MSYRRKARECALQLLYQWEGERPDPASLLPQFWKDRQEDPRTRQFAEQLFLGAVAAVEEIDRLIAAHAEHWRLDRMAAIDRNLLRLAVHELRARPATPHAAVINEALEIARRFSTADSVEFINGVLDAVRKSLPSRSSTAPPAP